MNYLLLLLFFVAILTLIYARPFCSKEGYTNQRLFPFDLSQGHDNTLNFFADTKFAPECCPNAYSSSTGCACLTPEQYTFFQKRAGNNNPYSVY